MASEAYILREEQDSNLFELDPREENEARAPAHAYPPDRGRHAWLFLWVGCFLIIALTWGMYRILLLNQCIVLFT